MIEKLQTLISKEKLAQRVSEIASEIERDYQGKDIHFICVLKGGVVFMADLARAVHQNVYLHFMDVSSYGDSTESSGNIKILMDLDESIKDKHVIIVEDIIDSGRTLSVLKKVLLSRGPASLRICTLLDKPDRRVAQVDIDYTGFKIPDEFVVGCGLDYAQKYRNLDYIGILSFEEE
ncbi:hypoxanthine phosphoribosyltransferase [Lachnospiraceae bacterium NSJ-143]|nr:hypoxanthine phosphoribosyltransferase [Lachnospiraceae bacterium NSJ-143]